MVLLVLLAPLVGLAFLLGLGLLYQLAAKELPLAGADRAALPRAADLAPWIEGFELDPDREVFHKKRYPDDSYELEYEYEEPEETATFYLNSAIAIETSAAEARVAYITLEKSILLGLALSGGEVTRRDRNDLLEWGDKSRLVLLEVEGRPVGNFFITRQGKKVFYVLFSGVYCDESASLRELLAPFLENLRGYRP